MPQRNIELEYLCDVSLVLIGDMQKLRCCVSESCEHVFGNMHQTVREFASSIFLDEIDKQK